MTLCDFKLQFHDPLCFQDAHAQTSYEAQLAKVDQSQIFLCFCLGDLGHWFWSWFSCGPHTGGKVTFLRSLLLDKDPHRWLAASTRSLPPAEKTLHKTSKETKQEAFVTSRTADSGTDFRRLFMGTSLSDTPLQNQPVSKQGRAEADECSEAVRSGSSSILLV